MTTRHAKVFPLSRFLLVLLLVTSSTLPFVLLEFKDETFLSQINNGHGPRNQSHTNKARPAITRGVSERKFTARSIELKSIKSKKKENIRIAQQNRSNTFPSLCKMCKMHDRVTCERGLETVGKKNRKRTSYAILSLLLLTAPQCQQSPRGIKLRYQDLCFVTSNFANANEEADETPNVSEFATRFHSKFFLFTNIPDLQVPGWESVLLQSLPYQRQITQSRWPKFLGWKHPKLANCEAIFYGDAYLLNPIQAPWWLDMAKMLVSSSEKHFLMQQRQVGSYGGGPEKEMYLTAKTGKADKQLNDKTLQWFQNQSDFNPLSPVYKNALFGYDPKNERFRNLTEHFWQVYSKEELTWRDQPFWSYFLWSHHVEPYILKKPISIPLGPSARLGFQGHTYSQKQESV